MTSLKMAAALTFGVMFATATSGAQSVQINGDDITITGCIARSAGIASAAAPDLLVWSRGNIMMTGVAAGASRGPAADGRIFYWLDDEDDLARYVGQQVEVEGELDDFQKGEIEVDRDGDFTEIELKLGGKEEKIRVPTSWLAGTGVPQRDTELKIVSRKIDVENVRVIGACSPR